MRTNNKLIRKTILSMFGGSLAAMITSAIALMADTILAGALFNKYAIAAVAVGTPIINIFQAITQTIINGASIHMNICAGKGEDKAVKSSFSVGVFYTIVFGALFIVLCQLFADWLVVFFGSAPEVVELSVWYLRGATGCIIMGSLNLFMSKTLALYGKQKAIFRSSFLAVACNVVFSILLVKLLPEHMSIMGLGVATWLGGIVACISSLLTLRKVGLTAGFSFKALKFSTLKKFVVNGLPSSGNSLADGVVSGVVNNIISGGFADGVLALSVFTAVKSIVTFATAIIQAVNLSAAPLFGIMYGSRDKNGILRSFRESLRLAIIALLVCAILVMCLSPVLANVFDMAGIPDFYIGLAICLFVYLPLTALIRVTTQLFEAIEKPVMGLLYSTIPDSIIFPVLLFLLIPPLGYTGIWLAFSLNAIPFILGIYCIRSIINKTPVLSYDRIFCLDQEIRENVPKIDISINSSNTDVSFISTQVYDFLVDAGCQHKIAHTTALCLEELAADFVEHTIQDDKQKSESIIMDIKLFADEDMLRTIIRNEASMYNPLDFQLDSESFSKMGVKLAQKLASSIKYNYVYKMNIITIDINRKKETK